MGSVRLHGDAQNLGQGIVVVCNFKVVAGGGDGIFADNVGVGLQGHEGTELTGLDIVIDLADGRGYCGDLSVQAGNDGVAASAVRNVFQRDLAEPAAM